MVQVDILPVKYSLGFPHSLPVLVYDLNYTITYDFNGDTLIMTVVNDNGICFHGKVPLGTMLAVKDPVSYEPLFGVFANEISAADIQIWTMGWDTVFE